MNIGRHSQSARTDGRSSRSGRASRASGSKRTREKRVVLGISRTGEFIRFASIAAFMFGLFCIVGWKFVSLQLHPDQDRIAKVVEQRKFEQKTRGERGSILDRRGNVLAMDLPCNTVAVDAKYAKDRGRHPIFLGNFIAKHLGLSEERHGELQNVLVDGERQYWIVAKDVDFRVATKLRKEAEAHKLRCVRVTDQYERSYPKDSMCAHVVGFSTINGGGVMGLESAMDKHLKGREGRVSGRLNNIRREVVHDREVDIRPTRGADVHLTIDMFIQQAIEDELEKAMKEYRPLGAWAICMETETGAVLGMGSRPHFNPNDGGNFFEDNMEKGRNRCVSFGFEPGSVIKPVSVAAVLDAGHVSATTGIFCHNGQFRHAGHLLRDSGRSFDTLTVEEVIMKSSNIGTAICVLKLAGSPRHMRTGMKRLSNSYKDFGFGERTGIGIPEEDPCPIPDYKKWSDVRLSRVAIGQGIRINGLQLCGAINTIANDGKRMQPYIVDRVISADGTVKMQAEPKVLKQVIRPETARVMREMMRKTVMSGRDGTGRNAALEAYETAGKTGTAQKYIFAEGRYSNTRNISSFVGFVPADRPAFTLVVILDEPKAPNGEQLGGGGSAAHVFKGIAGVAAQTLGVPMLPEAESAQQQARQEFRRRQAVLEQQRTQPHDLRTIQPPQIQRAVFSRSPIE